MTNNQCWFDKELCEMNLLEKLLFFAIAAVVLPLSLFTKDLDDMGGWEVVVSFGMILAALSIVIVAMVKYAVENF